MGGSDVDVQPKRWMQLWLDSAKWTPARLGRAVQCISEPLQRVWLADNWL